MSLTEAVGLFVAARRPFLDELTGLGPAARPRRGTAGGALRERLRPARPAPPSADRDLPGGRRRADREPCASSSRPLTSILALVFAVALFDQWRERRGGFQLIWAFGMVFYGIGAGCEAIAAAARLERGALPDLVPDRRRLDGGLARSRHGLPARPDPVRLQLRAVPVPGRAVHLPGPQQARIRGCRHRCRCSTSSRPASWPWRSAVETYFQNERWPMLAAVAVVGATRAEHRPDADDDPRRARLRARSGDRRAGRDALPAGSCAC